MQKRRVCPPVYIKRRERERKLLIYYWSTVKKKTDFDMEVVLRSRLTWSPPGLLCVLLDRGHVLPPSSSTLTVERRCGLTIYKAVF
jgi:hypothetical protein